MIKTIAATAHRFARPYSRLAPVYDSALGISNFMGTRAAFEALVRRYGIRFHSAADIGCGTGLFACYLRRCWHVPVFGVDRSPEMLRIAIRRSRDSNVCFLPQDIRCLHLPCQVDLITANFDTMNHLLTGLDLKLAFRRIWENLKPAGHFIFDLITPWQPLAGGRTYVRCLCTGNGEAMQRIRWNPQQKTLSIVVVMSSSSCQVSTLEAHRERAYSPQEVGPWLMDAGFVIRGMHDAVTLRMATGRPQRIIVIARKKLCELVSNKPIPHEEQARGALQLATR
jgi:SAM-dependent methyltransferase